MSQPSNHPKKQKQPRSSHSQNMHSTSFNNNSYPHQPNHSNGSNRPQVQGSNPYPPCTNNSNGNAGCARTKGSNGNSLTNLWNRKSNQNSHSIGKTSNTSNISNPNLNTTALTPNKQYSFPNSNNGTLLTNKQFSNTHTFTSNLGLNANQLSTNSKNISGKNLFAISHSASKNQQVHNSQNQPNPNPNDHPNLKQTKNSNNINNSSSSLKINQNITSSSGSLIHNINRASPLPKSQYSPNEEEQNQRIIMSKRQLMQFTKKFAINKIDYQQEIQHLKQDNQDKTKRIQVLTQQIQQLKVQEEYLLKVMEQLRDRHLYQLSVQNSKFQMTMKSKQGEIEHLGSQIVKIREWLEQEKLESKRCMEFLKIKDSIIQNLEWDIMKYKNQLNLHMNSNYNSNNLSSTGHVNVNANNEESNVWQSQERTVSKGKLQRVSKQCSNIKVKQDKSKEKASQKQKQKQNSKCKQKKPTNQYCSTNKKIILRKQKRDQLQPLQLNNTNMNIYSNQAGPNTNKINYANEKSNNKRKNSCIREDGSNKKNSSTKHQNCQQDKENHMQEYSNETIRNLYNIVNKLKEEKVQLQNQKIEIFTKYRELSIENQTLRRNMHTQHHPHLTHNNHNSHSHNYQSTNVSTIKYNNHIQDNPIKQQTSDRNAQVIGNSACGQIKKSKNQSKSYSIINQLDNDTEQLQIQFQTQRQHQTCMFSDRITKKNIVSSPFEQANINMNVLNSIMKSKCANSGNLNSDRNQGKSNVNMNVYIGSTNKYTNCKEQQIHKNNNQSQQTKFIVNGHRNSANKQNKNQPQSTILQNCYSFNKNSSPSVNIHSHMGPDSKPSAKPQSNISSATAIPFIKGKQPQKQQQCKRLFVKSPTITNLNNLSSVNSINMNNNSICYSYIYSHSYSQSYLDSDFNYNYNHHQELNENVLDGIQRQKLREREIQEELQLYNNINKQNMYKQSKHTNLNQNNQLTFLNYKQPHQCTVKQYELELQYQEHRQHQINQHLNHLNSNLFNYPQSCSYPYRPTQLPMYHPKMSGIGEQYSQEVESQVIPQI